MLYVKNILLMITASKASCSNWIFIDKLKYMLNVMSNNDTIFQAPIGCEKCMGNKTRIGDNKTSEGIFFNKYRKCF